MSDRTHATNPRSLVLVLDEPDWDTIHAYIADYQAASAKVHAMSGHKGGAILPDGDSNLAGAIMAECARNLLEYRSIWESENQEGL